MNILAIDTATESCSVALLIGEQCDQLVEISPTGHSKLVLGMVHRLLKSRDMELKQLDAIAVDTGPGSFTGLRIGIGVAQGLAYSSEVKTIGISSLQAMAATCSSGIVIPAIDARMQQIYWGVYLSEKNYPEIVAPRVSDPNIVSEWLSDSSGLQGGHADSETLNSLAGIGSGWDSYFELLPRSFNGIEIKISSNKYPEAKEIAMLAKAAGSGLWRSPLELAATYVRNEVVSVSPRTGK